MIRLFGLLILLGLFSYGWWYFTPHYFEIEETQEFVNEIDYICSGNKTINAKFYKGEDIIVEEGQPPVPSASVSLVFDNGDTQTLDQDVSASGVRYINENQDFVFWTKGNSAMVLENNEPTDYVGCIALSKESKDLEGAYVDSDAGFSIRVPEEYRTDASYEYPYIESYIIDGVKFTIPASLVNQTGVSSDTYISVETLSNIQNCRADLFLEDTIGGAQNITEDARIYSIAGFDEEINENRYEEIVYAIPGSFPCIGIRYFIHYDLTGGNRSFGREAIMIEFDKIRKSLIQA